MKPKVFILCPGAGRDLRGFEINARNLFEHIKKDDRFDAFLVKSSKRENDRELNVFSVYRQSSVAVLLGATLRRNPYIIQNATYFLFFIPFLLRHSPRVLYLADPPLYRYLFIWRRLTGRSYKMIFHTGGNTIPQESGPGDILQCVTPASASLAKDRGVAADKIRVIPHFMPSTFFSANNASLFSKKELRRKLGLPEDRLVILSVGALDASVKRMDYIIREVSKLRIPFYLAILGEFEKETEAIQQMATRELTQDSFLISRVPRSALDDFYRAADLFVLASLNEGFGRATLEALAHGLPVLLHPHPNALSLTGQLGYFTDMNQEGNLLKLINSFLPYREDAALIARRKEYVAKEFSWQSVESKFREMIYTALEFSPEKPSGI